MADNVTLNAMSGGTTVAADDISSVWHQRVKVQYGADGSATDVATTTPLPVLHALLEASKGAVTSLTAVHVVGANAAVGAAEEDIYDNGGTYPWPITAEVCRIKSGGNVNDDAAGTGAQSVTISGLDDTWAAVSETVVTAGTGASADTTALFSRVFRAHVVDSGAYTGANTGAITIENGTAVQVLAVIPALTGESAQATYTVPLGKTAYLAGYRVTSNGAVTAHCWQRPDADDWTTPFRGKRLVTQATGVNGTMSYVFQALPTFPAKTDIWWSAISGGAAAVEVEFDLFIVG